MEAKIKCSLFDQKMQAGPRPRTTLCGSTTQNYDFFDVDPSSDLKILREKNLTTKILTTYSQLNFDK